MPRTGPNPATTRIGAAIREVRHARGLTTTELAIRIGKSQQTISNWECGACSPALVDMPALAAGLELSPEHLARKIFKKLANGD